MKTAVVTIKGVSPLSQSAPIRSEKPSQEQHGEFELRVWRERINVDDQGIAYIPAMAFKNALSAVAKYLSMKVPGKRNATYTKHFEAGIMVADNMSLRTPADAVLGEQRFVPSDGKRGGGSRVWKTFPYWPAWGGDVICHILDDTITKEAFEEHIRAAGQFIGVGRFRPQNNGTYGRFEVERVRWV